MSVGAKFTIAATVFEAALIGLAHGSLLLIVTVTTSPLFNVVVVKIDVVCPVTFTPFTFH